jgi:hypothetical protein
MKTLLILLILCIPILTGCASTYSVRNFSSKEKFYDDFNKCSKDKNLKITLSNDSSFNINHQVLLENDTLFELGQLVENKSRTVSKSDLVILNSVSNDSMIFSILLKNNEKLIVRDITNSIDSIKFILIKSSFTKNSIVSIDKVKYISYKNNWVGTLPGILVSIPINYAIGAIIKSRSTTRDDYGAAVFVNTGGVFIFGEIIGAVIGYMIGYDYIYQFNP